MAKIYDINQFNMQDIMKNLAFGPMKEEDYKKLTDEELLEMLRKSSDFTKLAFPNSWYGKFDLPNKECMNMKEYLKESPWMRKNYSLYTGKIENIPAKPGGNRPMIETEPVKVEVLTGVNMFSDASDSTDQTASLHPQDSEQTLEGSTESNATKILRL